MTAKYVIFTIKIPTGHTNKNTQIVKVDEKA